MIAYLDANIVIYLVEQHAIWGPKVVASLAGLKSAGYDIATSDASRLECLVVPYRINDTALVSDYAKFLADSSVRVFPLTPAVCERAARIRAAHNSKPPDALHLAAALENGCDLFVTNDAQLSHFRDIKVELLV
jgi:uncharacterized protein